MAAAAVQARRRGREGAGAALSGHAHPLFARVYERFSQGAEEAGQAAYREQLLAGLSGRVVEVGAGNGMNFQHYPRGVTEVVAVEPEPYLRERAMERAASAPVPITVVDGTAEALPLEDRSVDAVVDSLVLCSVRDQGVALAEARRVLRLGGELRFYEHVASLSSGRARFERAFTHTLWKRMAGGCHLDRDTAAAIRDAGFAIEQVERTRFQGLDHLLGTAR